MSNEITLTINPSLPESEVIAAVRCAIENAPYLGFVFSNALATAPIPKPVDWPVPPAPSPLPDLQTPEQKFPHYFRSVAHLDSIDIYRVLALWQVTDPCIQHAVKKLLVAGGRGVKPTSLDVKEAIVALERFIQMLDEDATPGYDDNPF